MKRTQANRPSATIFSTKAWEHIAQSLGLSRRELQIVCAIFADLTEYAIAASLKISPHTVHTHLERLYRKLGVADRVHLVIRIMGEFLRLTRAPGYGMPPVCAYHNAGKCPRHN